MSELKRRLGLFLTILGVFVIVLFATSDAAGVTNFWLLAWGILSIFLGWPLMRNNPSPSQPSQRFRLLRRLFGKKDQGPPPDQG
jgi:hypothetical protein